MNWARTALIVVDVQYDFFPGGALPVPDGDKIIPYVNMLIAEALVNDAPVIFTADAHKEGSSHFEKWPVHCVAETRGYELHEDITIPPGGLGKCLIVEKGQDDTVDGYSGFEGRVIGTGEFLDEYLRKHDVGQVVVCGLALDYCVKETALDAIVNGYHVVLSESATRPVYPEKRAEVISELERFGVEFIS